MESFAVADMTAVTSAVLFRSESRAAVSTPMNALSYIDHVMDVK